MCTDLMAAGQASFVCQDLFYIVKVFFSIVAFTLLFRYFRSDRYRLVRLLDAFGR